MRVHSKSVEENYLVSLSPTRQTRVRGAQLEITLGETGGLWEDYRGLGKRSNCKVKQRERYLKVEFKIIQVR